MTITQYKEATIKLKAFTAWSRRKRRAKKLETIGLTIREASRAMREFTKAIEYFMEAGFVECVSCYNKRIKK